MQEFTKRHWRYSEMGNRVTQDDEKYLPIAEVYGCSFYPEEEYKANGRLMAAAPEMYALLENTAFYLQGLSKMYSLSGVFDYVSLIKELLARIDGEARDNND